jgi:hypothetical protein
MASCSAAREAMWWCYLMNELELSVPKPLTIFSDSQGSIAMTQHATSHQRSKHIDIKHHFVLKGSLSSVSSKDAAEATVAL